MLSGFWKALPSLGSDDKVTKKEYITCNIVWFKILFLILRDTVVSVPRPST